MSGQSEPSTSQSSQPCPDVVTKGQRDICSFAQCEPSSHHAAKTATPASRAREFPTKLHVDGDKLFCTSCNVVLNHDRLSVIVDHFASKNHKLKEGAAQEEGRNKHQKIITSTLKNKTQAEKECVEICTAWAKTLADANIPLSKTDHPPVREILDSRSGMVVPFLVGHN
ncbi:CGG triplet repeat-binding protein 1-like [Trachemys scripta elegans]|uniref:CGG triplet repeat-binding protein 1-like n=1 Tax=Trachemys scripta elegans TaxID=31138 RepID=UPI001556AAFA|nr:CGG triplet repeat-binding protein 1-like [Trachemys scripta elegans]